MNMVKTQPPGQKCATATSLAAFSTAVVPSAALSACQDRCRPGKRTASASSNARALRVEKSSLLAPLLMRSGQDRPQAIGTRMSGVPSCARMEASLNCTMEWMICCGWMTTLIWSGCRSNSQRASITSSALFIIVAESTEILRPIEKLGCAQAWSGVICDSVDGSRWRNGPPEAVSRMLSTRSDQVAGSSGRHWKMAECSLSMGSNVAPPSRTVCMNNPPPTTRASLLASSNRLPARAAARQGARPAAPTMAAITASTSSCDAIISRASCA